LDSNYGLDKFNSFFGIVIFFLVISILYYINNLYVSLGLLYLLISTIVISIARVDVSIIDPVRAGPRYFFYPYIILTWIFIQSFSLRRVPSVIQFASAVVLIAGLCNALISGWSRNHDDAEWELHIASGVHFKNYNIPIMFDGSRNTLWSKRYSKFQCEALLSNKNIGASNLYPFTIVKRLDLDNLQTAKDKKAANGYLVEVLQKNVEGTNYSRSAPAGYRPLGSYVTGDSDTGSVTLAMQRGARLLFTSGPGGNNQRYTVDGGKQTFSGRLPVCINWCLLDFSSDLLPDEFTVELSDEGLLWGEWFAIGLPEPE
jgi:hypothetical protein